mgnify:CR=1 FL=1
MVEPVETPLTRMLYAKEIEHSLIIHKRPAYSCEDVSRERNIPVADVLKCILVVDKGRRHYLFCLPGDCSLDLERCQQFLTSSRLSFATKEEAQAVTGQRAGTLNPFFHKIKIPIIFDRSVLGRGVVDVSSGHPNAGVQLHSQMLVLLVNPLFADVTLGESASKNPEMPKT